MPETDNNILHALYRRVIGEHPGEDAKKFIGHLTLIGVSFAFAKVISSLTTIAAGRMLGPQEYGKVNLMVSTGAAISAFLLGGMQYSVVRYGSEEERRRAIFSTAAVTSLALTCVIVALVVIFSPFWCRVLGISRDILFLAVLYAVATAAFLLVSSMQQSLGAFSKRGKSEILFSFILASAFFLGVLYFGRVYKAMAGAYMAAFGGMALFWLVKLKHYVRLSDFSKSSFFLMSEYGFYNFGGGVGFFFIMNVQAIMKR